MVPTMLGFVEMVTQQPIDDMRLAVIAFDSAPYRWDGVPDEENKIPKGWAALPSKEAVDDAQSFIISNLHDRFTYFSSPVLAALDEPVNDLSIILVTDGKPTMPHEITTLLSEVTARQAIREEKGLGKAVIYTVFIGVGNVDWLKVLSEGNGGGYFRTHD